MSDNKCIGRQLGSKTASSFKSLVKECVNLSSCLGALIGKQGVLQD